MVTPKKILVGGKGNSIASTSHKKTKTSIMKPILINIIVFLFGVSIGGIRVPGANNIMMDTPSHNMRGSHGTGTDASVASAPVGSSAATKKDESLITAAAAKDYSTFSFSYFKESTSMDWTVPEDIRQERHKECEGKKTSSTGGFCLTKQTVIGGNNWVDKPLAEYLRDHVFKDKTVIDLGAGLGHYGKIFMEEHSPVISWVGFDGAMNVQNATDGLVRYMDLTQPHAADERPCIKGDWVLSLEVAEHIPPQFTDSYIRNIRCSCRIGAVVSWALPSQTGGLGHVNTKHQKDAILK